MPGARKKKPKRIRETRIRNIRFQINSLNEKATETTNQKSPPEILDLRWGQSYRANHPRGSSPGHVRQMGSGSDPHTRSAWTSCLHVYLPDYCCTKMLRVASLFIIRLGEQAKWTACQRGSQGGECHETKQSHARNVSCPFHGASV
jgi:hypothetical protein